MDTPSTPRFRSLTGLALTLVLTLGALALPVASASAGEPVPEIDFRILKIDCTEDPGTFPEGEIPEGCSAVEGVDFTIEIDAGETLECTTNAEGRCTVQVPSEANVTVTEDEATGTDGYAPRENPIETQAVTEFAGAVFVNLPVEEPPTTDLPDTGAGVAAPGDPAVVGLLGALAALLALGGAVTWRMVRR